MSVAGGDFELVLGQDMSVGYSHHDREQLHLYLLETLTFRTLNPDAAVPLRYSR